MHREAFKLYRLFILSKAFLASNNPNWTHIFQKGREGYTKIKFATFDETPMKHYFYAFAKKGISNEKFVRLCACAHFIRGKKFWIHDLVSEEVLSSYLKIQHFLDSFEESAKNEILQLNLSIEEFLRKGINYPKVLELYIQQKISIPLLIAFERQFKVLEKYDADMKDKPGLRFIWESYYKSIKKWDGFFFENEIPRITL